MTKIDRLLIGALVLGVWALVAMQFFGGMTASAAQSTHVYGSVELSNWHELLTYCAKCN